MHINKKNQYYEDIHFIKIYVKGIHQNLNKVCVCVCVQVCVS